MTSVNAAGGAAPTLLDALSLLTQAGDEILVDTARDTHLAWVDRIHGVLDRPLGPASVVAGTGHRAIASAAYLGAGLSLKATGRGLGLAARAGRGAAYETGPRSRFVHSAVNGLIGHRLSEERPRMSITMAPRVDFADVSATAEGLAAAYPGATGRVAVFLHGLCENESYWNRGRAKRGTTYAEELSGMGWTPVMLRANTGLSLRENGVSLASLLETLTKQWPVPLSRLALVGHSMGGLIARAGCCVQGEWSWHDRLTDVITLGTPHLGAPLAEGVRRASAVMAGLPEVAGFGRILDQRSSSIDELILGLDEDIACLPHTRYRLVSATLATHPRHPVSRFFGDILVRQDSAYGRDRWGRNLFADSSVLHVRGNHFDLLNHGEVAAALRTWLAHDEGGAGGAAG